MSLIDDIKLNLKKILKAFIPYGLIMIYKKNKEKNKNIYPSSKEYNYSQTTKESDINIKCKICNTLMFVHDKAIILNKYNVTYYICPHCEFIQTENPYWLEEAYSKAISSMDTGIMSRNLYNADTLLLFIYYIDKKNIENKYLDFGGGHGVFTRIMRDNGFDFYWYDKFAENLFANGFEGNINDKYQMITSFENFEHFVEPISEIERLINITDILYFSTALLPENKPLIKDWWYYAPAGGQHIVFYSIKTFKYIANKFNINYYTDGYATHIFSRNKLNKNYFKILQKYNELRDSFNIESFFKKKSKTSEDFCKIISIINKGKKDDK